MLEQSERSEHKRGIGDFVPIAIAPQSAAVKRAPEVWSETKHHAHELRNETIP